MFDCNQCGQTYRHKSSLFNHVRTVHQEQKLACKLCSNVFQPKYLKAHIKRCQLSGNKFNILQNDGDISMEVDDQDEAEDQDNVPRNVTSSKRSKA